VDLAALPQHPGEELADSFRNAGVAVQDEQEGRPKSVKPSRIVMQLEDIPLEVAFGIVQRAILAGKMQICPLVIVSVPEAKRWRKWILGTSSRIL